MTCDNDGAGGHLYQQIGLHVGVVELAGLQLVGQPRGQVPQQRVLAVPDGQVLVLRRGRDDLNQDLGLVEAHSERLDGGVVDEVVGGDHAEAGRRRVHVLLNADTTLGVLELVQRALNHLRQVVRQVPVGDALHVVVVGFWVIRR